MLIMEVNYAHVRVVLRKCLREENLLFRFFMPSFHLNFRLISVFNGKYWYWFWVHYSYVKQFNFEFPSWSEIVVPLAAFFGVLIFGSTRFCRTVPVAASPVFCKWIMKSGEVKKISKNKWHFLRFLFHFSNTFWSILKTTLDHKPTEDKGLRASVPHLPVYISKS